MTRVGLDFGGVIVPMMGADAREDTEFGDGGGFPEPREGTFETIARIVEACSGDVWIVSRAGRLMQARTRDWLHASGFHARTGLASWHVHFCERREDKVGICRELAIEHFVDDRVHLMQLLRGTVPHLYLFGEPGGELHCPPWARYVTSWPELGDRILATIRASKD